MNDYLENGIFWTTKNYILLRLDPKDQILLDLSKLNISSHILETTDWKKFLGVLLDKNLTQKEQINSVENKIAESIPILIKRRSNHFFNKI